VSNPGTGFDGEGVYSDSVPGAARDLPEMRWRGQQMMSGNGLRLWVQNSTAGQELTQPMRRNDLIPRVDFLAEFWVLSSHCVPELVVGRLEQLRPPVGLEYRILCLTCRFVVSGSVMRRGDTRW
jgi:hypothetical protein